MKDFILLLKRFVPPYKKFLGLNILMNILSALLNLGSFHMIMPILEMLFQINKTNYTPIPFDLFSGDSWDNIIDICKNNFYWYMSQIIEAHGPSRALLVLALFLIISTILRTAAMYFSFFYMIPIPRELFEISGTGLTIKSFHCLWRFSPKKEKEIFWRVFQGM